MVQRQAYFEEPVEHFGLFLKTLRVKKQVKQGTIVNNLPGWTRTSYIRMESGEFAPQFDQLFAIYRAFHLAGISFPQATRQQFLDLARKRIDSKRTYLDRHSDEEWAELRYQLARLECLTDAPSEDTTPQRKTSQPLLADTSHLLGREEWHEQLLSFVHTQARKKVIIIRGSAGVGKSSEVNWLATHLFRHRTQTWRVVLCDFRSLERVSSPQEALDILLGTLLTEFGYVQSQTHLPSWEERTTLLLEQLEQTVEPIAVLVDHCACLLQQQQSTSTLAPCWERFLTRFLRSHHTTTLIFATQQWPGWYGGEQQFLAELALPPLSQEKGVFLLQQLGLEGVPVSLLKKVYQKTGGIPLCLEWVATLAKQPLFADDWETFGLAEQEQHASAQESIIKALQALLEEPHIFGGSSADELAPLLERILATQRLSPQASALLNTLAVATIPLAKPALQVLCNQGPRPIKELRRASVLVTYSERVQLLPMVAAAVYRQFSPKLLQEQEKLLIPAYNAWLQDGTFRESESEQGSVIAELAALLLKQHNLLEAAELLIQYGWMSFHMGYGPRLARIAEKVMKRFDWHTTQENECSGVLLQYWLSPFLGKTINDKSRFADYQPIYDAVLARKIELQPSVEVAIMYYMMTYVMDEERFNDAQALLEACSERLEPFRISDIDLQVSLLEKRSLLLGTWCEYAVEKGELQQASDLRQQTIALCKESINLLSQRDEPSSLKNGVLKKRLARAFNNLAYHLNRIGQYEEALQAIERCITSKEMGYVEFDKLADAYGEKSQILAGLGRFQEAMFFDEKAVAEVQKRIDSQYTFSRKEMWIYLVNRGCLYLRLGRVVETEQLLREALPHIHPKRRMYRMFANDALREIEQWRNSSPSHQYQLDWRWVERYRQLDSFDSYWWLAPAGPFTEEEQQQWNQLFSRPLSETTKEQLGNIMAQSRDRELKAAIDEQREPVLLYPALDIEEVRQRIAAFSDLDAEIRKEEPNAIVRRFYQGAIEEETNFLRLIEATYEGDTAKFWEYNLRLNPLPTPDEMNEALSHVKRMLLQGQQLSKTDEVSKQVLQLLHEQLHLSLDLTSENVESQEAALNHPAPSALSQYEVTAQAAKRFFESAMQESGYEGWMVEIDPNAGGPRIEQGLRRLFLPDTKMSIQQIRKYFAHEVAGHVARCVAGERSPLGLLGINTKNSLETEEGFTLYQERQILHLHGQEFDDSGVWLGTLATGLASGVVTPPQAFLSLFTFFESFLLLFRLLALDDEDIQTAQTRARRAAFNRCIRTFRGVPNLERPGICYSKDALYLRGLKRIEQAASQEETILDRVAVGVVALEQLPDLQELGIVAPPSALRKLAYDPNLDSYIASFEQP